MKKYLNLFISFLIIPLLLVSCKDMIFSPEGENFVDIKAEAVPMTIDLDKAQDTILVMGTVNFNYTIDTKGKVFSKIEVFLDTAHIATTYDEKQFPQFNSAQYPSGPHKLIMQIWAHSGTGSLGDVTGREYLVSTYQWNLFIDNRVLTEPLKIEKAALENGTQVITWQQYPFRNFISYEIYKAQDEFSGTPDNFKKIATITSLTDTKFTDTEFVGGTAVYKVIVNSYKSQIGSPTVKCYSEPAEISSVNVIDDQKVQINWRKIKYYANLKKYVLYSESPSQSLHPVATLTNASDTTYTDNCGFGEQVTYYVRSYGGSDYSSSVRSLKGVSGQTGSNLNISWISSVEYFPELASFYINGCRRLDGTSMKTLAEFNGHIVFSNSGKVAVANSTAFTSDQSAPHSFTTVDPLTLQMTSQTRYTNELVGYYSTALNMVVSETGVCFFTGYRFQNQVSYGPPYGALVSLNPYSLAWKDSTIDFVGFGSSISKMTDEGEYILSPGRHMINLKNGRMIFLYEDASGIFLPSGKEYLEFTNGMASVYSCKFHTLIRSFPINSSIVQKMIDPATGYLGCVSTDSKFTVYDPLSGSKIKEVKILGAYSTYYFANSTLFSTKGLYLKLNYN